MPENKQKIILTNEFAMRTKYSEGQWAELLGVLDDLIRHDAANRSISTRIVYIDDTELLGEKAVRDKHDWKENKIAVDAVYELLKPDFLILLGADDIIPFQMLKNPAYNPNNNRVWEYMPSDLPYACAEEYSTSVDEFLFPERVVSRIPDVAENADLGYQVLMASIRSIINMPRHQKESYLDSWAVCTMVRVTPMQMSLTAMNGDRPFLYNITPPNGPRWPMERYQRLLHFHIVHGSRFRNILHGESTAKPPAYPISVYSHFVDGNMRPGTVILERACFGAQLYNPVWAANWLAGRDPGLVNRADELTASRALPLSNMYMYNRAAAFLGSGVQNYSNMNGMKLGDHLMVEFFNALHNCSVGEAFLTARLKVMCDERMITNSDKTMYGAYVLYGDASLVPMADIMFKDREYMVKQEDKPMRADIANDEKSHIGRQLTEAVPAEVSAAIRAYIEEKYGQDGIKIPNGGMQCNAVVDKGAELPDKRRYTQYATAAEDEPVWFAFDVSGGDASTLSFIEAYTEG